LAKKSSWDRQTDGKNLVWFGEIDRKISQIINDYLCLPFFLLIIYDAESAMIANPSLKAYRYDPYSKEFTQEFYAHDLMKQNRKQAIQTAKVPYPYLYKSAIF
jgi:hypothetical protein